MRAAAAVLSAAAVAAVAVSAAFSADPAPTPTTLMFTATKVAATPGPPGATPALGSQIVCSLTIDYPHKSTHVPTTVNTVSHIYCDSPVPQMSLSTQLYRNAILVGSGSSSNWFYSTALNSNAAANCVNGNYLGSAQGSVKFPPGYYPPADSGSTNSPVVGITC